jgi:hypothetical protein
MRFASFRRLIRTRHLAWLLALACWLPAAQWAAATHALLHLHAVVTDDAGQPAHLPASCDTCVVAATLGSAAPAMEVFTPAATPLPTAQPQAPGPAASPRSFEAPYQSRAPPLLHA